ncbi:MAG: DUF2905 domain-containing protein [Bacteroidales bacterium]|nr:DUF2905 domain-containing protein [Bacteroidales bacterium]
MEINLMQNIGKTIIFAGIIIIAVGLLVYFFGNKLNWFGNLPGDIKIKKENFSLSFPVTTMILISIVLSIIVWIVRKL